jgi:uncharacterized membrane protein YwaF
MPNRTFVLFGPDHLAAMAATVAIGIALGLLLRRTMDRPLGRLLRPVTCYGLAVALLGYWLADDAVLMARGEWTLRESLPLHMCDLALLLCVATLPRLAAGDGLLRPQRLGWGVQTSYELVYYWGLGGSTQALLTPDVPDGFPSFLCVRFFMTHGGTVVAVLLMTIGLGLRPRPRSPLRVWVITALAALPVALINWLLGTNYMYLCGPPTAPSLYDYLGRWPWTLLSLAALAIIVWELCYLPFWIADRRQAMAHPA